MKKKVFLSLTFLVLAVLIFGACSANRHVRDNRHNHHGNNYFARNYPNHNQMVEYRDENGNIVHRATYENNRGCRRANNVATRGAHHYEEGRGCRRSGTGATRYARHNVDRAYHQPHHNNDGLHHSKYDAAGPQYRHKTLTPQAARRIPNPFHRKDIYANECCDKYFYKNGHNNNDGIRHNLHNFGEDAKHNLHNFGEDTKQNLHNFGEDTKHNFERIGKAFNRASARVTEDEVIEDKTAEDAVRPNQGGNGITQIMGGSLVSAASFFVREDKTPDEGVRVPVIMYHSILKSRSGKFVVSPAVLEADMLYLIKQGYTTVFTQDVIDYVKGLGELPEKPIIVTFDDGFYNNMVYALPIFNELGLKGVINIVGHYADKAVEEGDNNPNYSHLSWEQMRELSKSGVFEIGNHTYD
ncbi:MAG: polysaccharide deacetylase family protein, partial [Firmicutes bacterium]|nr:polysaccharide deacetylase family protein [Bacillota bacterium]